MLPGHRLHRAPIAPLATVLALSLALQACGTTAPTQTPVPTPSSPATLAPSATPGPPVREVYAQIRRQVEAIRGLEPTADVNPVVIDETQLRANLEAEFDAAQTPAQLKDTEDLLITLGLLPTGASLRALTLDFQGGQVAGYYSPEKNELFVVSRTGTVGPADESTYAHEFTHQLQDQHFDLEALGIEAKEQSDQALARLALVEGDAVSAQTSWMGANLDSTELGEVLAAAMDPAALAALERAPRYLLETSLFPYQDGFAFVTGLLTRGGYKAVDAAFANPPDSTEQILHTAKYLSREPPIVVQLPRLLPETVPAGWSVASLDTLGELLLRIWLTEGGVANDVARVAAAGWGGDRVALLRGPGGALTVVIRFEWDTAADADEFAAAATTALAKVAPGGRLVHKAGSTVVEIGIGDVAQEYLDSLGN